MRVTAALVLTTCFLSRTPAQQPAFRGGVELVTVDVRVVGPDGQPVTDLRPDDVVLKIDGKVRAITSLNLLRVGVTVTPGAASAQAPPAATAGGADKPAPITGRTLILVFDHEHIRPNNEKASVDGAIKALDGLAPGDRVALVTLPNGRIVVNLTTDVALVRRALPLVVGGAHDNPDPLIIPSTPTTAAQYIPFLPERVGCTMLALRDFLGGLRGIAGPKTIVLVSEGFSCESPSANRSQRIDTRIELQELGASAGLARAQVYVVQPNNSMAVDATRRLRTGSAPEEEQRRDDAIKTLEDIAGVTGGDLFRLSGSSDAVFDRVVRETAAYYELGFEPAESDRNGKDHAISVKVSRPKTTVRARLSFSIPKEK